MTISRIPVKRFAWLAILLVASLFSLPPTPLAAQSLPALRDSAAFKRYQDIQAKRGEFAETGGRVGRVKWSTDGNSVFYTVGGQGKALELNTLKATAYEQNTEAVDSLDDGSVTRGRWAAGRAEQLTKVASPDGKLNAIYRDYNVFIEPATPDDKDGQTGNSEENSPAPATAGKDPTGDSARAPLQITSDGTERHRYGTCCWVYGEELYQDEAMWWSPDGKLLVFYEVDEAGMKDYYLTFDNTASYTRVEAVRYPKAGDPNPQINLMVYDLEKKQTRRLDIPGQPTQYLYKIRFAPNSQTLLVNRTNRHQDVLDVLAIDLTSGELKTVVTETQSTWQDNSPLMRFLADGQRFIWETESNGYKHYQLRNLAGELLNPLSDPASYPCEEVVLVDEKNGWFYYSANSDANPYNAQLHRVKLDGTGHQRISSSPLNHTSFMISPSHSFVVAVREAVDTPHQTVVYDTASGREIAVLANGDNSAALAAGIPDAEMFKFVADDGQTEIWGILRKPSGFDPEKQYPLVIDVYGGPTSRGLNNTWSPSEPICELGFLVAKVANRGTTGRGKAFESATYMNLGQADIADQAQAVRHLRERPYIDGSRVGIYGHSYGGYMSALGVLKFPDVFHVGVAGAPVTDWRNYDTIYTERYMRTPQENSSGYVDGSCVSLVDNLQGNLLIVHGLIDDNVHPANTWQLAEALQKADKRFDMMIYPGFKHGIGSNYRMLVLDYLHRHLVAPFESDSSTTKTGL